ncbi:hypothetical protein FH972_021373 [Carpinus fangiana]|uniref:Transcription elongation factor SPT5 n=1 Tax=Carpinus fangiana TaxID=176857 RepID=A0A5N6KPQ8_9ROSI|nr:hypothetical protein FH972_021373 [Carpinus fangiana]
MSDAESDDVPFNPAPAYGSDEEEDDAPQPASRSVSPRKRPRQTSEEGTGGGDDEDDEGPGEDLNASRAKDDAEDEDDEDEEDDDEDDDEEVQVCLGRSASRSSRRQVQEIANLSKGHRRKRYKRDRRNQFLDVEAEVDDEDEGLDDDEDEGPGNDFVADTHPDDEGLAPGEDIDDAHHRELDRKRQQEIELDAEEQAARFKERYGRNRVAAADSVIVPQRLLLPSVEDPTIWGVRCKKGKEQEIIRAIYKRLGDRINTRDPLAITAAFERASTAMEGFIYVEGRKRPDIITATENIPNCYPHSKDAIILVSIPEMPDLLRVQKTKTLDPGMYVRIKRPLKYQGDLAQITEIDGNGVDLEVRIVPREDYGMAEDQNAPSLANGGLDAAAAAKRKRMNAFGKGALARRAPQRLFSEVEAKKRHGRMLQQVASYNNKQFTYMGNTYINGFLHLPTKIPNLQSENVNPTLEEVSMFTSGAEDGAENLDLAALAQTLKASNIAANYLPGDLVEVYQGEQQGVIGKAVTVHGDIVTLKVSEGELQGQTIEAPVKGLRKRFREGDHVRVIGGSKYQDEVGMVVRIKDDRVSLLSDATQAEITVFSKDLRAATDTVMGQASGKYDLQDLVQLDPSTVGVVIKVDRESLRVLDQDGGVRTILPSQITDKIEKRKFAAATDREGSEIRNDDTVKEYGGEQRQGRVLHIHRAYLFLHNRTQLENAGIFVVRATSVLTVAAAKGGRATGPDLSKMNPNLNRNGPGSNGHAMPPPPKYAGRDRLLGKTVIVRRGPYKSLLGIVKDTTEKEARVELHSKSKIISVSKDIISVKDPITGATQDMSRFNSRPSGPPPGSYGGSARVPTGYDGSRTPAAYAGSATPGWAGTSSGKTPGWSRSGAGAGGRTPAAGGYGGSTSYGGYGGATSYGGATAYGGGMTSYGGGTSYGDVSGSRTPAAYNRGGATPAHNPYDTGAPTPGAYAAPTPGASGDHATPGYGLSAPTPGAGAPTPALYTGAPTPGGAADDDGYE